MSARYKVAIVGTGRRGGLIEDEIAPGRFDKPYGHFSAYGAVADTGVVAVANRGAERLKRFSERFGVTNTYLDYREMIEKERPDIISVTTRSWAQAEIIVFAAQHGVRGIFAEKGLCASLAEADRIVEAVRANGVAINWGPFRRHHDGFKQLRAAVARGDIGEPRYAMFHALADLTRHHSHSFDTVEMLFGDPAPLWVEGRFAETGHPLTRFFRQPLPTYDEAGHRFVLPPAKEVGDPLCDFFRMGYDGGLEACFIPLPNRFDVEVHGTEGRVSAWDNGLDFRVRRSGRQRPDAQETIFRPAGESPTICTVRDIVRQLDTGERTSGNIDVIMNTVEAQFGLAHSHLSGGARVMLPVQDRTLYIPGG